MKKHDVKRNLKTCKVLKVLNTTKVCEYKARKKTYLLACCGLKFQANFFLNSECRQVFNKKYNKKSFPFILLLETKFLNFNDQIFFSSVSSLFGSCPMAHNVHVRQQLAGVFFFCYFFNQTHCYW